MNSYYYNVNRSFYFDFFFYDTATTEIYTLSLHYFFFNATATTEIYTLSLHAALPISGDPHKRSHTAAVLDGQRVLDHLRSEEHTSELQSRVELVCRLLLERKK